MIPNDHAALAANCAKAASEMRAETLAIALRCGENAVHLGGVLSCLEILATLYLGALRFDNADAAWDGRDRFILSKGHAALAQYLAMRKAGLLSDEDLDTFAADFSAFSTHPTQNPEKRIEYTTGSLGQGLAFGVGSALSLLRRQNTDARVFVLLGDGECAEGSVWEAAASASRYGLANLTAIIDRNGVQYDDDTEAILPMCELCARFEAFGWQTILVDNGHDTAQLLAALQTPHEKPLAIVANTVKGKGVPFMEHNAAWHHAALSQKQYDEACEALGLPKGGDAP